jgi:N-acetylmuramoyl-L-alanine amidase
MAFADTYKVTADSVNVRKLATTDAIVVGKVNTGDVVEVVEVTDKWKKIRFGSDYAWVYGIFLKAVSQNTVMTNGQGINIRSGPSTNDSIVVCLDKGAKLTVLDKSNDWTKIKTVSGMIGWVYSPLVSPYSQIKSTTKTSRGSSTTSSRGSDVRSKIVSLAYKYLGVSYVYGGSSPNGFDCSGFSKYVLRQYGYNVDRVASEQSRNGSWISKDDLLPGDLVFFDTNGGKNYINHVGIYIGKGNMIHASSGSHKVMVSNINEGFYSRSYMTARRIID